MRAHPPASASSAVTPRDRLWPLRGEFADASLEQAFREVTLARVVPQQRIGLLVWALLQLVFAVPDYLAMGPVPGFWLLAGYRVAMAVLLLAYALALGRMPELAIRGRMLMWLGLIFYPSLFLFYAVRPEMVAINTGVIMVVQLTMFLFIPVRVMLALPVAVFGAVGAALSYWAVSPSDLGFKVSTVFLVGLSAIMGYVAALRLQKTERQEFWLRQQLQEANRELQCEVARRLALQEELERQAGTDQLTGLANRRALASRFAADAARAQRGGETLSLAMFDLDHFKRVNDEYGHAAGDAVLRSVGLLCNRSFREMDAAARVGGEEFAVLLPCANLEQAAAVMQRFAEALASTDVPFDGKTVRITTTVGVAQQRDGENLESLMTRADTALYSGKQAGRNRVMLAPAPAPAPEAG